MSDLNPCPQCGSEPDFKFLEADDHFGDEYVVGCKNCRDTILGRSKSANGAINAWNAATSEQPAKTLRDEFAMAAISGYMATGSCLNSESAEWAVTHSYEIADLMLRERNK